jgi:hypothetical protein
MSGRHPGDADASGPGAGGGRSASRFKRKVSNPMSYPSSIDSLPNVNTGDVITATHENAQSAAVLAIENTLGINPQGAYSTVASALAAVNAPSNLFLVQKFT